MEDIEAAAASRFQEKGPPTVAAAVQGTRPNSQTMGVVEQMQGSKVEISEQRLNVCVRLTHEAEFQNYPFPFLSFYSGILKCLVPNYLGLPSINISRAFILRAYLQA